VPSQIRRRTSPSWKRPAFIPFWPRPSPRGPPPACTSRPCSTTATRRTCARSPTTRRCCGTAARCSRATFARSPSSAPAPRPAGAGAARATALAQAGITAVCGLAAGIDTEALAAGARTLAVLGHGLARPIYPRENAPLAAAIAEHGALVSAFWPDMPLAPATFRARKAVSSGLSRATLVVEAGPRSGARLQVRLAHERGRRVYMLRSLVDREPWAQASVTQGRAELVDDAAHVLTRWPSEPGAGEGRAMHRRLSQTTPRNCASTSSQIRRGGETPRSYTGCNGRRI
jgi:hypothetical protein